MPLYEYRCEGCGNKFEKLVRGGAAVACPTCGSAELEQQYSTFSAKMGGSSASPQPCAPMPSGGCGMCGVPGSCGNN